MRTIVFILGFAFLFSGCAWLLKDEKLTLSKIPYAGNEIRTDGYYYVSLLFLICLFWKKAKTS